MTTWQKVKFVLRDVWTLIVPFVGATISAFVILGLLKLFGEI